MKRNLHKGEIMNFFTSDIHLGDDYTVEYDLRPFKNAKHMEKFIFKTWNKQAKKSDKIYIIGDFIDCDGEGFDDWKNHLYKVKKLKADVILIIGNNEERVIKYYFNNSFENFRNHCLSLGFKEVYKNLELTMRGSDFFLTHKPGDYNENVMNLFGHTHAAGGIYYPFGLNVGCDLSHFRLLSENNIFHFLEKKEQYWDKDKHLNLPNKQLSFDK